MSVAERYILLRVVKITAMTLGSLLTLVLMSQVLVFVNVVTDSGDAIWTFLSLGFMLIPSVANIILPFALLIAVCQTFNTMHTESEIIVIEAAGASRKVQIRPVMLFAGALAALTLANTLVVEPYANRQLRDVIASSGSNLVRFAVRSGTFHRLENNLYIEIAGQLPGGGLQGLTIVDVREPDAEFIYYARRGQTASNDGQEILLLSDGEIHRRNAGTGEVSVITFTSYALDFATFSAVGGEPFYFAKERSTQELLFPNLDDRLFKSRPDMFRNELHRRLSDWLYPLAFGVIALFYSVGARSHREERLWTMASAAGVALLFRGAGFGAVEQSGKSLAGAVATYAVPLTAIVLFGALLMTGRRARLPQPVLDRMAAMADRARALRARLFGATVATPPAGGASK